MTLNEAIHEFEFDCKIRHLSPKTIDNYRKQLRYFERFLGNELSITSVEDVRPSHIKSFLSMMDDAGRKPQYINDLLKVYKTFFNYLETEGHIESSPANGTDYARITAVADGTEFEHVATAANGWHAVKVGSQVGWVSGKYSEITTA